MKSTDNSATVFVQREQATQRSREKVQLQSLLSKVKPKPFVFPSDGTSDSVVSVVTL
eukprot:m.8822 g.8822  ORF g.8822 m.8822 type:complete len:57 (-) comp5400_c0_seq1:465-635(-)